MKTIWKQELEVTDIQMVKIPKRAKILCVQVQREKPCVWFECNPEDTKENRIFRIYGTGHPMDELGDFDAYVGTFQIQEGALVFHVYEQLPKTGAN